MTWSSWDLGIPALFGTGGEQFISSPAVQYFANSLQVWAFTKDSLSTIRLRQIVYVFGTGWVTAPGGDWFVGLALPKGIAPQGAPALTAGLYAGIDRFWVGFTDTNGTIRTQRYTSGGGWNSDWVVQPTAAASTGTPTFVWREGWGDDTGTEWLSLVTLGTSGFLAESRKWTSSETFFDTAPAYMNFAAWIGLPQPFVP